MGLRNFFAELKRRNVYKVAVGYGVVAWLIMQVADTIVPALHLPDSLTTAVVVICLLGFPIALVIAWAFELTPDGIVRTAEADATVPPRQGKRTWVVVVLAAGALSVALFFVGRYTARPDVSDAAMAKSIAVLPFANLSRDPDNAFFADGIQDEILTRLAKISELKVISRTSTQRYKSSPENLPEIAKQLGVAHILEGSVQKTGEKVRVTVQLIRAGTDSHLWAESYDRNLTDILAVESEVAAKIAESLQARLSGTEQRAVAARPTENAEAYEAFLRGLAIWNQLESSPVENQLMVVYLDRAVQLDPQFAVAWAYLSVAHTFNYAEFDASAHHLAEAKRALDAARRLAPESGETQFALGFYYYRGLRDFDAALVALAKARSQSANRVAAIEFSAYVKRRQGKWEEALVLHAESLEIDPRNPILLSEAALSYRALRRFREAEALVDQALAIEGSHFVQRQKAEIRFAQGDTQGATRLLDAIPFDPQEAPVFFAKFHLQIFDRKYAEAIRLLRGALDSPEKLPAPYLPRFHLYLGLAETLAGESEPARASLAAARAGLLERRARGDHGANVSLDLIMIAGLLRDKAAFTSETALAQKMIKEDAVDGPSVEEAVAMGQALFGEIDASIAGVQHLLQTYGESCLTPAYLRLDPRWDPLRSDPRFQKMADAKP
ncbi:MAG: hypothetical protein ABI787_12600 [Spartobacteria bacterium]